MVVDAVKDFVTSRTGGLYRITLSKDCEIDGKQYTEYHARMYSAKGPIWYVYQAKDGTDIYLTNDGKTIR